MGHLQAGGDFMELALDELDRRYNDLPPREIGRPFAVRDTSLSRADVVNATHTEDA